MTTTDTAYLEGFTARCREHGVDPTVLAKAAQYTPEPTVNDFFNAINSDMALNTFVKNDMIAKARAAAVGIPASAPVSRITSTVGGAALGFLVSKYFGASTFGRAASTFAGAATGHWLDKTIFNRDDLSRRNGSQFRGFRGIG